MTGKFQKGVSGNPAGRPKKTQEEYNLEAACRARAPDALNVLLAIMEGSDNERNKILAAQAILDRGYGKPRQAVTGPDNEPLVEMPTRIVLVAGKPDKTGEKQDENR